MQSWGAYLLFLSMDRSAITRLNSSRILSLTDWQEARFIHPSWRSLCSQRLRTRRLLTVN